VIADLDQAGAQLVDSAGTVVHRVRANRMVTVREAYQDCPMFSEGSRYGELLSARAPTTVWRDQVRRFDYAAVLAADAADLEWARGRIVLVGAAVETERFTHRVGLTRDVRYGVERHADAIATILSDAEVRPLGGLAQLAFIAVGAVAGWWIAFRRSRRRRRLDAALVAAALGSFLLISAIGYRFGRTLIDIVYPGVALLLAYAVVSLLRKRMVQ
jgi:CHASE2 domain-containing sensor protein